jgi:hypothetical protein
MIMKKQKEASKLVGHIPPNIGEELKPSTTHTHHSKQRSCHLKTCNRRKRHGTETKDTQYPTIQQRKQVEIPGHSLLKIPSKSFFSARR